MTLKVQPGEFQSTEVHCDTKHVATSVTRLQLKGLCAGGSLWFISLGWIKIIANNKLPPPTGNKEEKRK